MGLNQYKIMLLHAIVIIFFFFLVLNKNYRRARDDP